MKILVITICVLFFVSFRSSHGNQTFRDGILTEDYGIVSDENLVENLHIAAPWWTEDRSHPNLVWQCLLLENAMIDCEYLSYDEDVFHYTCFGVVKVVVNSDLYVFDFRHLQDYNDYKDSEQEIKKILLNEDIACFSAFYSREDKTLLNSTYSRISYWTIDRIKSRKGMWSYFTYE